MVLTTQQFEFEESKFLETESIKITTPYGQFTDVENKYTPKKFQSSVPSKNKRSQLRKKRKRKRK